MDVFCKHHAFPYTHFSHSLQCNQIPLVPGSYTFDMCVCSLHVCVLMPCLRETCAKDYVTYHDTAKWDFCSKSNKHMDPVQTSGSLCECESVSALAVTPLQSSFRETNEADILRGASAGRLTDFICENGTCFHNLWRSPLLNTQKHRVTQT